MTGDATIVHRALSETDAARLRARPWVPVDLDFFGVATRLWVGGHAEAKQWRHFYKHHLGTGEPLIEVWLEVTGAQTSSFLDSVMRQETRPRAIYVRASGRLELWSRFEGWSTVPSPLPPFQLPPLSERVLIMNASCVRPRGSDGAILFAAPRYNGKSTIANAFVERGGVPLGDNLAVLERSSGRILPYLSPTGIRAETVSKVPGLARAVSTATDSWTTISEVTGKVYLLHFDEIYAHPPATPAPIRALVYPTDHRKTGLEMKLSRLDTASARARADEYRVRYSDMEDPMQAAALARVVDGAVSLELDYDLSSCDVGAVVEAIESAVEREAEIRGGAP